MSTNSVIIIQEKTGRGLASIYCHWDGYPSHHLPILVAHYGTYEKVLALVALGGLSSLDEQVSPSTEPGATYSMDGVTVAYHRDRGEDLEIMTYASLAEHCTQEYAYLFKDGEWFWSAGSDPNSFARAANHPDMQIENEIQRRITS
jgi:hypothetical protein